MSRTYYFRATPEASAAFLAQCDERHAAYHKACDEIQAEFPDHELIETRYEHIGFRCLTGLQGDASPGPLWTKLKGAKHWTPSRRYSKAGIRLCARINDVRVSLPPLPGFPQGLGTTGGPGGWQRVDYGHEFLCGIIWASTTTPQTEIVDAPDYDASIWTPAPTSSYWLAKEKAQGLATAGATP